MFESFPPPDLIPLSGLQIQNQISFPFRTLPKFVYSLYQVVKYQVLYIVNKTTGTPLT